MTTLKLQSENTKNSPIQSKLVKQKPSAENSDNKVYGTGRRKNAIARVWLKSGSGKVIVNKKNVEQYFTRESHTKSLLQPFVVTKTSGQYDIICTVKGGGKSGQMGAVLHGVARALDKIAPEFHSILRKSGFLTRDSRVVERKKYGKHKARKSTQFSKR
ncbi:MULTISPECIES: 30S ribosomal protein S9 [Rickettsieae]|uniref:30S ribosomal protein S9 n=1 Tax=Rickettsieae TaxID=33988 RepID=UPI000B9B55A3|nr:30S ribosomal protein S9 [Rickettsia endosymbiont of Culicoides newsteadi]OZG31537.1 30S ribosomal protein S9 [Rickettsia endosymbiont of Culicoides newsteadi]HJD56567.1 30S ribosomal protein S9 [Rickettsia endosymbiont of Sericostoma sp. HW-2014]